MSDKEVFVDSYMQFTTNHCKYGLSPFPPTLQRLGLNETLDANVLFYKWLAVITI